MPFDRVGLSVPTSMLRLIIHRKRSACCYVALPRIPPSRKLLRYQEQRKCSGGNGCGGGGGGCDSATAPLDFIRLRRPGGLYMASS